MIQATRRIGTGLACNHKISISHRTFISATPLRSPVPNDQDDLEKDIEDLESDFNEVDDAIEKLTNEIREGEVEYEDDEGETELSKMLEDREYDKHELVKKFNTYKDHALFSNEDEREDKSLMLELIAKSAREDKETLRMAQRELDSSDSAQSTISDLIEELDEQEERAEDLLHKWHENDLNFIRPSDSNTSEATQPQESPKDSPSFPQDSSDVTQTDFDPFDDMGE